MSRNNSNSNLDQYIISCYVKNVKEHKLIYIKHLVSIGYTERQANKVLDKSIKGV